MIEIERKFHPVGHGAFYTEKFNIKGKGTYNIIYDCGTSGPVDLINDIITKEFPQDTIIDCLIISHFHKDHINGIPFLHERCKIKKVVIPLLDNAAKTLAIVEDLDKDFDYDVVLESLIYDSRIYFGERAQVVEIAPTDQQTGGDANSGDDVSVVDAWHFFPYNHQLTTRLDQFKRALGTLTIDEIKSIEEIRRHWKKIIDAYDSIRGNPNNNSMILLSIPNNDEMKVETIVDKKKHGSVKAGCLYMGDISMKAARIRNDVLNKLEKYKNLIGTLQVPHHGAKGNFHKRVFELGFDVAIFSCKKGDIKHPCPDILSDMETKGKKTFIVTEEPKAMVIQMSEKIAKVRTIKIIAVFSSGEGKVVEIL